VQHFMRTLNITSPEELRQADHKAVIAWESFMRETEHAEASTIRRRLSALSSLYSHLVRHGYAPRNPVREVERPAINRDEGSTLAFSKAQARKILDAPKIETPEGEPLTGRALICGLRDRAILSVGLQVGLRRAEIAALKVGDLHQNRGYDSLRVARKGGRRDALAINPQTAARLRAYLEASGHAADIDGPLFRPLNHNGKQQQQRRRMDPDAIRQPVGFRSGRRAASLSYYEGTGLSCRLAAVVALPGHSALKAGTALPAPKLPILRCDGGAVKPDGENSACATPTGILAPGRQSLSIGARRAEQSAQHLGRTSRAQTRTR
jgi:integrase